MEKCSENRTAYLEGNRLGFDSVYVARATAVFCLRLALSGVIRQCMIQSRRSSLRGENTKTLCTMEVAASALRL